MSTRGSGLLVRAIVVAGFVAFAAVFVDVARAGTPADAVTTTVAAATQPAAAPVDTAAVPDAEATLEPATTTATSTVSGSVAQAQDAAVAATGTVAPTPERLVSTASRTVAETKGAATEVVSSTVRTSDSAVEAVASATSSVVRTTSETAVLPAADTPVRASEDRGSASAGDTAAGAPPAAPAETVAAPATERRPAASREPAVGKKRQPAHLRTVEAVPVTVTPAPIVNATDPPSAVGGPRAPRPHNLPGGSLVGAFTGLDSAGGLLLFGLVGLLFLLVIPKAVRWLRPALALGLSPAYVATRDRPG